MFSNIVKEEHGRTSTVIRRTFLTIHPSHYFVEGIHLRFSELWDTTRLDILPLLRPDTRTAIQRLSPKSIHTAISWARGLLLDNILYTKP
jgi:hypothetical protein